MRLKVRDFIFEIISDYVSHSRKRVLAAIKRQLSGTPVSRKQYREGG